jgi:NDP-hexose-3-ketoreductase
MKILILGYSNLLQKNVLPILNDITKINSIEIATNTKYISINKNNKITKIYSNYDDAIEQTNAKIVYITTMNVYHKTLINKCLTKGLHVIVDKPAFLSNEYDNNVITYAKSKNLMLSEAIVYSYHRQINVIKEIFTNNEDTPIHINATFTMPGFEINNFRYNVSKGGGAFNDLASYALTVGGIFFNSKIISGTRDIDYDIEKKIDVGFRILLKYENMCTLTGFFSFSTTYLNSAIILGTNTQVSIDRIFTIPNDYSNALFVKNKNGVSTKIIEPDNTFYNYFINIIEKLEILDFEDEYNKINNLYTSMNLIK